MRQFTQVIDLTCVLDVYYCVIILSKVHETKNSNESTSIFDLAELSNYNGLNIDFTCLHL